MIDSRAAHLLKTLVERYIAEGQPVGSRALSRQSGLELSPATIRNVMADLEEMGFVASPHTSAGRVPTAKGYRFFVDTLMVVQPLEQREIDRLEGELVADRPRELAATAAQMLSQLTRFAGVVVTPRREQGWRHIEFLRLGDRRVLMILVTPQGDVQNRILHTDRPYAQAQLVEATNYFNQHFTGQPLPAVRAGLAEELKRLSGDIAALMSAAVDASAAPGAPGESVVLAGERNLLAAEGVVPSLERMRQLFDLFERRTMLVHLLDQSQRAEGVQIYIGGESGLVPLDEMSVVTAPFQAGGRVLGTLGVIGPTRMAYERVIPIVDVTAKLLSNAMAQQLADS